MRLLDSINISIASFGRQKYFSDGYFCWVDTVYKWLLARVWNESENDLFRSQPGHRVPRYSTMNWAVCVPSSCSHHDVELALKRFIEIQTNGTGISVEVRVAEEMCQEKNVNWLTSLDRGTKIAM